MKVRIKQSAAKSYINYMVHSCRSSYSDSYVKIMERIAGRICEVSMRYTSKTSYNIIDPDNSDAVISVQKLFCEEV